MPSNKGNGGNTLDKKNIVSHAEYKQSASQCQTEFVKAKCNYEKELFADNNYNGYILSMCKKPESSETSLFHVSRRLMGPLLRQTTIKLVYFQNIFLQYLLMTVIFYLVITLIVMITLMYLLAL